MSILCCFSSLKITYWWFDHDVRKNILHYITIYYIYYNITHPLDVQGPWALHIMFFQRVQGIHSNAPQDIPSNQVQKSHYAQCLSLRRIRSVQSPSQNGNFLMFSCWEMKMKPPESWQSTTHHPGDVSQHVMWERNSYTEHVLSVCETDMF